MIFTVMLPHCSQKRGKVLENVCSHCHRCHVKFYLFIYLMFTGLKHVKKITKGNNMPLTGDNSTTVTSI